MLRVPQVDRDGDLVDNVNRIDLGARFVRELVEAGL
jgi:hypothetical protein